MQDLAEQTIQTCIEEATASQTQQVYSLNALIRLKDMDIDRLSTEHADHSQQAEAENSRLSNLHYRKLNEVRAASLQAQEDAKALQQKLVQAEAEREHFTMQLVEIQQQLVQHTLRSSVQQTLETSLAKHELDDPLQHIR